jgi:hypothetical protein
MSKREVLPDILISHEDTIPSTAFQPLVDTVSAPGLALELEARTPSGPQAGLFWLLPTAAIVFIARSYLDGFLKEAGKDHYQLLKKGIASLWPVFFGEGRAIRATLVGTPGKIPRDQTYSITFSMMAEANSGLTFKLLLRDDISAEEYNFVIAEFLDFLSRYYSGSLDSPVQSRMASSRVVGRTIVMAHDTATGCFVFLDPTTAEAPGANWDR